MLNRVFSICQKINHRGFSWLVSRLSLEYRIPETSLGKKIKPLNHTLTKIFRLFSNPGLLWNKKSDDILYMFYDLEVSPITFDFCWALAIANKKRKLLGLKYIQVVFVPGPKEGLRDEMIDYEVAVQTGDRYWRFYHLILPMIRLLPACNGAILCSKRQENLDIFKRKAKFFYPNDYDPMFPTAHRPNEGTCLRDIQCLTATPQSLKYIKKWLHRKAKGRKVIAITLRTYNYMTDRNSNIEAWAEFAKSLDPKHYFPVIVPDTAHALDERHPLLTEIEHFSLASWNIEFRAALYELCYLNMGVNNGPLGLCWLNEKCRYLIFKIITPSVPQATRETLENMGFIPGHNPIFATKFQKWVWKDDKTPILVEEFEKMCDIIENASAMQ